MDDEALSELSVGLSEDEKDDLERLIKEFRQGQPVSPSDPTLADIQHQLKTMAAHTARLSDLMIKVDSRMKSFYEVIRFLYENNMKTEQRIYKIAKYIKAKKNL